MITRRIIPTLYLALLASCSSSEDETLEGSPTEESAVTLRVYGSDVSISNAEGLIFAGRYTALTSDNPSAFIGDSHMDDPASIELLDQYLEATKDATQIVIQREGAPASGTPLYEITGCVPNETIHNRMDSLGVDFCTTQDFGSSITFVNVQMARRTSVGSYDIYDDYVAQCLPIFLDEGSCVTGAWLCDDPIFDGVFVPSYASPADIQTVSTRTETELVPTEGYGDATCGDLRRDGVEINARTLLDVGPLPSGD